MKKKQNQQTEYLIFIGSINVLPDEHLFRLIKIEMCLHIFLKNVLNIKVNEMII